MPASCAPFTNDPPTAIRLGVVMVKARALLPTTSALTIVDYREGYFDLDYTPVEGDLILVTQEGESGGMGAEFNGIYTIADVTDYAVTIARATIANTAALILGIVAQIEVGTEAGKRYQLITPAPIVLDTTALTFSDMSASAATLNAAYSTAFTNTPPTAIALT